MYVRGGESGRRTPAREVLDFLVEARREVGVEDEPELGGMRFEVEVDWDGRGNGGGGTGDD